MKVKTNKPIEFLDCIMPKGIELTVRPFSSFGQDFLQVKEGNFKDYVIKAIDSEPINPIKTYSQKEWSDREKEFNHLQSKYEKAIDIAVGLSTQIVKKNKEIEKLNFYVSALTIGLSASSEAIQALREKEKV
jgi:hypothetical protein